MKRCEKIYEEMFVEMNDARHAFCSEPDMRDRVNELDLFFKNKRGIGGGEEWLQTWIELLEVACQELEGEVSDE